MGQVGLGSGHINFKVYSNVLLHPILLPAAGAHLAIQSDTAKFLDIYIYILVCGW